MVFDCSKGFVDGAGPYDQRTLIFKSQGHSQRARGSPSTMRIRRPVKGLFIGTPSVVAGGKRRPLSRPAPHAAAAGVFTWTSLSAGRRGNGFHAAAELSTAVQKWALFIGFEQVTEVGVGACRGGTRAPHGDDDHLSVRTMLPDLPRHLHTIHRSDTIASACALGSSPSIPHAGTQNQRPRP